MRFTSFAALAAIASAVFVTAAPAPEPAPAALDVRAPDALAARTKCNDHQCNVDEILIKLEIDVGDSCGKLNDIVDIDISVDIVIAECGKLTDALHIAIGAIIDLHGIGDLDLVFGLVGYVSVINKLVGIVLLILGALAHVVVLLTGSLLVTLLPIIQAVVFLLGDLIFAILGLLTGVLGYLLAIVLGLLAVLLNPCKPLLIICGQVCYDYWKNDCGLSFL